MLLMVLHFIVTGRVWLRLIPWNEQRRSVGFAKIKCESQRKIRIIHCNYFKEYIHLPSTKVHMLIGFLF